MFRRNVVRQLILLAKFLAAVLELWSINHCLGWETTYTSLHRVLAHSLIWLCYLRGSAKDLRSLVVVLLASVLQFPLRSFSCVVLHLVFNTH